MQNCLQHLIIFRLTHQDRSFFFAEHSNLSPDILPVYENSVVLPNLDFPIEIHNEDFHYTRLMPALFKHQIRQNYRYLLVIQNLNHFLFPNIFPDGHGHYNEVKFIMNMVPPLV